MRHAGLTGAALGSMLLALVACATAPGGPTATQAAADPQDSCGPQVVVFVNAGDLFGSPPRRSGPPSAAELEAELVRENAALERLQIAFDALLYCRWTEVRVIRAETPPAALPARLREAQTRMQRDLDQAERTRAAITARAARIDQSVEAVAPGTRAALSARRAADAALPRAVASAPVPLRIRPEADAPIVGRLTAGAEVSLRPAAAGFAYADGGPGLRGYAPGNAFTVQAAAAPVAAQGAERGADRLRSLAATNIARRDAFAQSLELAGRPGAGGFEQAS
ncbi:hypothetical protein [Falsiroseomonas sp. E2-1-a4]|uniref:hypothetical protein n=1 Tax=Falsiroseomonas sp. E2-1-a4 TaxID=3239299 RepID=UPI003F3B505E